jgi:NADH dehydrogenase
MIFVTGASGFVGRHLVARQVAMGRPVRGLMRTGKPPPVRHSLLDWYVGDVTNREDMNSCLAGIDTVVHLAAVLSSPDEAINQAVNAESTRSLVQLCRVHGIRRFILMSAAAATFQHMNAYGRSKRKAEEILGVSGFDYAIIRVPLIIGRGSDEWMRFIAYIRKIPGLVPVFGSGQAIKCPIYIDDAVDALCAVLDQPQLNQRIWEIACPNGIKLDTLIDLVLAELGLKKYKLHIPLRPSLLIAALAEGILGAQSPITRDIVLGLNQDVSFDSQSARIGLSINPRSVDAAVAAALHK